MSADGLMFADILDWLVGKGDDIRRELDFDLTVEDGGGMSQNTGVYLYVGTADPLATSTNAAAEVSQEWPNATAQTREETGSVVFAIHAVDGGGDQRKARNEVVAVGRVLLRLIRRDVRLGGIDGLVKTSVDDINFDQGPTDAGAEALLVMHLTYSARIQGGLS